MGNQSSHSERYSLRVVMAAIPDASILVDPEGRIVAANELVTSLLGWPVDELEGQALETLIPDRFREIHAGHVAGYLDSPEVQPMDVELDLQALHHDGSEIPVMVSLRPILENGPQYVIASIRDLRRQTRLHEELLAKEQRFRIAAELTADVVQEVDLEQGLIQPYSDIDSLMGYQQGEFPRTVSGWIELIHPDDRDRIGKEAEQAIKTGSDWHFEYRILDSRGSVHHWIDAGVVTELAEDGSILKGIGVTRDVTREVEAREKLQQTLTELSTSDAQLRSIFTSIPDSVAVIGPSGRVVAVNSQWTNFAKRNGALDETKIGVGANYLGVCSTAAEDDPDAAEILAGIRSVLDGSKKIFRHDYPCHSPSVERWFTVAVTPLDTGSGGAVLMHRDITERTERRQQLEKALAEVDSLKDQLAAENVYLQEEIRSVESQGHIVGESGAWIRVLDQVRLVAGTTSTVLLTGETGTGKELIAREVHAESGRSDHTLIKVNCAALPATLIESELFGHEKGAFTGAEAKRQGRFALADRGTIFLDEIGELPVELQAKLLHVLQDGEFEPLGAATPVQTDVRVIAATNRDLEAAVREGRFRSDLYYRLAIFPIELPPLRDRPDDIPLLAAYFLGRFRAKHGKPIDSIPEITMQALQDYDWPGNVRELENVIERGVIVSTDETLNIDLDSLAPPRNRRATDRRSRGSVMPPTQASTPVIDPSTTLEEMERTHVISVLEACRWTVKGPGNAAERLGLKESTLRSRMKKLGIRRPS